ncbi:ScbR family autoregulator-binding transcription factor [Streptomyces sp. H27-D2]|uniref:ScbR family autoregulator-binding transcription factor n=1 Tax=Streptomyces sp. H27-D2 TaxID=3046304 RepID=UPI002DBBFF3D|nr:ScbR family autoregulator-binding transcription factor [Streptomyces sp. H27-D2]MEC4015041.1 ScbR family autoregulator-binding transcription factor [Streptomyces sp. H27-D2]
MARPRQERAEQTRWALLHAAAEAFDEHGYAGAGLNKILGRAGVTAGAMYFHFKSKEDLARAVVVQQAAELCFPEKNVGLQQLLDMCQYLAVRMQGNVLFRAGVRLAVEQNETNLLDYSIYDWWAEQFQEQLIKSRELGQLLPEADEARFSRVLVAAYTGTQIMARISSGRADLPDRISDMWRCLLPAIAPPEVIATLDVSPWPSGRTAEGA